MNALLVTLRIVVALACVAAVIVLRPSTGWGALAGMLAALVVLLALLAEYNRRYR
ncbi:DUF6903 family protein [Actinoplanes sp. RD1]|uniref:DUF6903 family protein n=1 Tax=Actinoplanes sp. RD1 TaxID=3064538 RepID=UPI0027407866|nr:hypothetical protein [Actinoplanes sp. RD1]